MTETADIATRNWTEVRFRYLADVRKGHLPSSDDGATLGHENAPYLTMEYLRGENNEPTLVSVKSDLFLASDDDILLLWDGSNAGEFLRAKRGVVSSTTALVTPKSVDPTFLFWACKAQEDQVRAETVGMGIPHVNGDFLANLRIQLPGLNQQRTIADYLDRETARLDALVAEKKRLLGLLAEKRRALITCAVTRGLDSQVPLRDSGIPWLGEIPAHWQVTRLKFVASVQTGIALGKSFGNMAAREYPYLRVANVQDGYLDLTEMKSITVPDKEASSYHVRIGDVLMNEGGDADKLGRGAIWTGQINPCLHQNHVFAVRPRWISPDWLNTWTSSNVAKAYFESRAKQSTNLASISASNLREMPLLKPPDQEQRGIVDHITCYTAQIDNVRKATKCTIALLKERRSALIVSAMTGQLDLESVA